MVDLEATIGNLRFADSASEGLLLVARFQGFERPVGNDMLTDPIADMLTQIRNAIQARHNGVTLPYSRVKEDILRVLNVQGYVPSYQKVEVGTRQFLRVALRKGGNSPYPIEGLRRVSKPGCRVYAPYAEIPKALSGFGLVILSTPRGILSDKEARETKVGGEILCEVW